MLLKKEVDLCRLQVGCFEAIIKGSLFYKYFCCFYCKSALLKKEVDLCRLQVKLFLLIIQYMIGVM